MKFTGKTVVVTGAGSGIGAATATRFAAEGARVAVTDIDAGSAERVASVIVSQGGLAHPYALDVASEQAWQTVAADVGTRFGPVDVLHANAYRHIPGTPETLSFADWQAVQAVNVGGLFWGVRTFAAELRANNGAIIATSSVHALIGLSNYSAYAASKGALLALCRQLAAEYGNEIRVNSVIPGPIETGAWDAQDLDAKRAAAKATILGRLGTPEEVAAAVVFLASDDASFITGASLIVDGGWSASKDSP